MSSDKAKTTADVLELDPLGGDVLSTGRRLFLSLAGSESSELERVQQLIFLCWEMVVTDGNVQSSTAQTGLLSEEQPDTRVLPAPKITTSKLRI